MTEKQKSFFCILVLVILVLIFFGRLFYPEQRIFITPDQAISDLVNLNYSLKYFLGESLKNGFLPLWSKNVANGFPVVGESQIGAFNLPNIILFSILPITLAFNISYVLIFAITALGMFFFARLLRLRLSSSLVTAVIFTFSSYLIFQIPHPNVLQTVSFLPWLFIIIQLLLKSEGKTDPKRKLAMIIIFSLLLSQQFFSGFAQTTVISMIGVSLYLFLNFLYFSKSIFLKNCLEFFKRITLISIIFLFLSAVQIFPLIEYTQHSTRKYGFAEEKATFHSLTPRHLLTFLNPFILGNPQDATYSFSYRKVGAVFWENILYIGIIPLFAVLVTLFFLKKDRRLKIFWFIFIISLALALGKYSPLYILHTFPPLNAFRTPSRFIILSIFSLAVLAGFGSDLIYGFWEKTVKRKSVSFLLMGSMVAIVVFDLFLNNFNYNAIIPLANFNRPPQTAEFLRKKDGDNRFFQIGGETVWNNYFVSQGWRNNYPFLFFRNDLNPNLNLLWNLPSTQPFPGSDFQPLRSAFLDTELIREMRKNLYKTQNEKFVLELPDSAINLIRIKGAHFLISPFRLINESLEKVFETNPSPHDPQLTYKIYQLNNPLPRFVFANRIRPSETVEETLSLMEGPDFNPKEEVILDKKSSGEIKTLTSSKSSACSSKILEDLDHKLSLKVNCESPSMLTINDTFYPGWQASIDGQKTKIYSANLAYRAVYLPEGSHSVKFDYKPFSIWAGSIISITSYLFFTGLVAYLLVARKGKTKVC